MDEHLKDYPDLHDHVLEHEFGHAKSKNKTLTGHLVYEFKHDVTTYYSTSDVEGTHHEYFSDKMDFTDSKWNPYAVAVVDPLRVLWTLAMLVTGVVYRGVKQHQ